MAAIEMKSILALVVLAIVCETAPADWLLLKQIESTIPVAKSAGEIPRWTRPYETAIKARGWGAVIVSDREHEQRAKAIALGIPEHLRPALIVLDDWQLNDQKRWSAKHGGEEWPAVCWLRAQNNSIRVDRWGMPEDYISDWIAATEVGVSTDGTHDDGRDGRAPAAGTMPRRLFSCPT